MTCLVVFKGTRWCEVFPEDVKSSWVELPAVFGMRSLSRAVPTVLDSTAMTATEFQHLRQPRACTYRGDDVNLGLNKSAVNKLATR